MLYKFGNKVALVDEAASGIGPNGKRLYFNVVDIFGIVNGMIAEHWDVADSLKNVYTIRYSRTPAYR